MYTYDRRFAALHTRLFFAMSMEDAKAVLGFPPGASPSPSEVNKAYKTKAVENHPDRGGSHEKMVEINVAKEILEGKRREDRTPYRPTPTKTDPEAERRKEEDRKREHALSVIAEHLDVAIRGGAAALRSTNLVGHRINLGSWLVGDYHKTLDKIHNDIEDAETKTKDMIKAQNLVHMLTGMSHRLSQRFLHIIQMSGAANAAQLGLGGEPFTWLYTAGIYFEMKKFFVAFGEFKKASGNLNGLLVTSEQVPGDWADLYHSAHSMIDSFEHDFKGYSDYALKMFGMSMQKATKAVMAVAGPFGFTHHGDWQKWVIPDDFEEAKKFVMATK